MKRKYVTIFLCCLMLISGGCGNKITQEEYDSLKTEKEALETEIQKLEDENQQLSADLSKKDSELSKLNDEYESYKEKISAAEAEKAKKEQEEAKAAKAEKAKKEQKEAEAKDADEAETTDELKVSDLFKDVYLPYAKREKPFVFDAVKTFAQNTNSYTVEIQDPTADDVGTIKFTAASGDYVYIAFTPNSSDIDMIMTLSYYQASTNSEVSLDNYSTDRTPEYDTFNTHVIGGDTVEVDGPEKQQDFLFKK